MKLIPCPLNGPRPADEFICGGEVRNAPDPATCGDADWARHVFHRSGVPGIKKEWWCHTPSGYWFIAERDTTSDEFIASYPAAQLRAGTS
jgi:sarcosine oxidase, subunit delta